eukprot:Phypoly_transcript_09277.p1 GENE.Phypoly_transcript_09277~~Phypoly_transcript_09277.p1  ORF type:complete len:113 (+),score=10.75 Phypoly_transcript_09277:454-792(+)
MEGQKPPTKDHESSQREEPTRCDPKPSAPHAPASQSEVPVPVFPKSALVSNADITHPPPFNANNNFTTFHSNFPHTEPMHLEPRDFPQPDVQKADINKINARINESQKPSNN